jgi:hypothetical protein
VYRGPRDKGYITTIFVRSLPPEHKSFKRIIPIESSIII